LFSLVPAGPGSPLASDDETQGVEVGALWQNTNTGIIYRCTVNTAENAVWVEYYAPGALPIALDVPATPNLPFLSSANVQDQLGQANTQFALQLLANAQFNADITALENTVTALDGVNGLTRTGDDFLLGGTLDAATTIDVDGNSLTIVDATNPLVLLVDGAFPSVGQNLVLQTSVDGGSGANGIGSSIEFQAETTAGAVNRTAVIRSRWTDAAAQDSDFQIAITEGGLLDIGLTVNADKSVTLNGYNSTTFEDPAPAYLLGVDASGNVVQTTGSSGPLVYVARVFQSGTLEPTATEIANTTGATFTYQYVGVGSYRIVASIPVFTTGKTAVFLTAGNSSAIGNAYIATAFNNSTISCRFGSATGFFGGGADGLLQGATLKIEIYP
jgi:sulfur carrier protein ThiS